MSSAKAPRPLGERVVAGVLWMGAWRWTGRLLGFVNIIVIARLLLPDDLGLVATALIVVVFFDSLVDLGTDKYLIRLTAPERADYDTAWTLRLVVICAAALLVFLSADAAARYFEDPRLAAVLRWLAAASLLRGFTNIGLTIYRRELRFGRIALVGIGQRAVGVAATVICAFALQNYWAIVIGEVALRVAEAGFSYLVHPYRPRFAIARFRRQWEFSKWLLGRNLARFAQARADQFVVARFFGLEQMGFYAMALRLAELPTRHLVAPMGMPIYAGLARRNDQQGELARSVEQVIGATAAVVLPAATLVAALSEPLVIGLFGEKWRPAVPLAAPLVFMVAMSALAEPAGSALTVLGRVRLLAALEWAAAIVVVAVMLPVAQRFSLAELAYTRMALALALACVAYGLALTALKIPWQRLAGCLGRTLAASAAMAAAILAVNAQLHGTWPTIFVGGFAGCAAYLLASFALWRAAARPDAGEALIARRFAMLVRRHSKDRSA